MSRDLDEVIASQERMLANRQPEAQNLDREAAARLLASDLIRIDRWLMAQPNFRVLDVDHRQVLENPAIVSATVSSFLDGRLDSAAMAGMVDHALYRNRAPQT
jgi:hypothetical protein